MCERNYLRLKNPCFIKEWFFGIENLTNMDLRLKIPLTTKKGFLGIRY